MFSSVTFHLPNFIFELRLCCNKGWHRTSALCALVFLILQVPCQINQALEKPSWMKQANLSEFRFVQSVCIATGQKRATKTCGCEVVLYIHGHSHNNTEDENRVVQFIKASRTVSHWLCSFSWTAQACDFHGPKFSMCHMGGHLVCHSFSEDRPDFYHGWLFEGHGHVNCQLVQHLARCCTSLDGSEPTCGSQVSWLEQWQQLPSIWNMLFQIVGFKEQIKWWLSWIRQGASFPTWRAQQLQQLQRRSQGLQSKRPGLTAELQLCQRVRLQTLA